MFEFQLSLEYDLLGFLLNSSLSSSSAAISYQSFKERLIQRVPHPALYIQLIQSLLELFPVIGGAKVQPLFLTTKFFRNFF